MIRVEKPGLRTTVQDFGRPGLAHLGIPRSGAADLFSFRLVNGLVGNPAGAAALETTLIGPTLFFADDAMVALTGAPVSATIDGEPVPFGSAFRLRSGQTLRIGRAEKGLRTYVGVAGGIAVEPVLGSRSADTLSGLGPAPLLAGERLPVGPPAGAPGKPVPAEILRRVLPGERPARVVEGPRLGAFSSSALEVLCGEGFEVSARSDRVGARLVGPTIERARDEAATAGMVGGAIQVPPDSAPIVLLADHATTGGYPVIAVVVSADLPMIAQARPGDRVRFTPVSPAEARAGG